MKSWLAKTHGPGFELLRHFLLRFFDSDLITTPDHWVTTVVGAFSVFLPWFPLFIGPLREKYAHFSAMPVPGPFRQAVEGDALWLITLMMSGIGLMTAIKWPSLFPGLRDYQSLGTLPLRARQIFTAKLIALLTVTTAAVLTLNAFPSLGFPMVSSGRWQFLPSMGARVRVHAVVSVAACYFCFFALVALQGLLLNLLRARAFGRISGYVQGLLVAAMVIALVLSFSIRPETASTVTRPEIARWLPPVWFLGLYQTMLGDPDPAMHALGHRAVVGLIVAMVIALASYLVCYRRHRTLLMEGIAGPSKDGRWGGAIFGWLIPRPRQQAVIAFMLKTLTRSSYHRVVLMGYGGLGLAFVLSAILGLRGTVRAERFTAACFVYAHVILLVFALVGVRQLFAIPTELKAHWMFQITEGEGRREWLRAVDHLVLFCGAVVLVAIPLPLECMLLGWRAFAETVIFATLGLLAYEWAFSDWEKLPFTCSHLPGKTPMWILTLAFIGFVAFLPAVAGLLLLSLYNPLGYAVILTVLVAAWTHVHAARRDGWGYVRLKYEEVPDPAVQSLNLLG